MTFAIWFSAIALALTVVIGLIRVATATDAASRAVVGDLVYFATIGQLMLLGIMTGSQAVVDAALLAALLGILATIALSRIITRGRR